TCRPCARRRVLGRGQGAVGAGEAVVGVDAFGRHPEVEERLLLGGEVLLVGGAGGVADEGGRQVGTVSHDAPSLRMLSDHPYETRLAPRFPSSRPAIQSVR